MKKYQQSEIEEILFNLRNEKAMITMTDTVMGILALDQNLIYKIKKRPRNKKVVLFVNNLNDVAGLELKEKEVLTKYWPGALTIIKNRNSYRHPNDQWINILLNYSGPIYASSANLSNQKVVKSYEESNNVFKKNDEQCFYVESSTKNSSQASTIIDLDKKIVLRQGEVDGQQVLIEMNKIKDRLSK